MTLYLTRSRYVGGLLCLRRLWLLEHGPPVYEEPAPGTPLDVGNEIGRVYSSYEWTSCRSRAALRLYCHRDTLAMVKVHCEGRPVRGDSGS